MSYRKLSYVGSEYDFLTKSKIEIHPDETFFREWRWTTKLVDEHLMNSDPFEIHIEAEQNMELQFFENRYWAESDKYHEVLTIIQDYGLGNQLAGSLYVISSQSQMIKVLKMNDCLQSEAIQTKILKETLDKIAFNIQSVKSITIEIDNDAIYREGHHWGKTSVVRIDEDFVLTYFMAALVRKDSVTNEGIERYIDKSRIPFNFFDKIDNRNHYEFRLLYLADQFLREFAGDLIERERYVLIARLFDVFNYFKEIKRRGDVKLTDEDRYERNGDAIRTKLSRGRHKYLNNRKNKM